MFGGKRVTALGVGLLLALLFVAVRGGNSAVFLMAKSELPDFAVMAVSMSVLALASLVASLLFERPDWGKLADPASLRWTLAAGATTFVSVYAFLRSLDYIPPWLTQSFVGLEPLFAAVCLYLVARVVADVGTRQDLLGKLPANWWLFGVGLLLAVAGVTLMALSKDGPREP
jgi:drug/metabolite transporter (DMT)-like permease